MKRTPGKDSRGSSSPDIGSIQARAEALQNLIDNATSSMFAVDRHCRYTVFNRQHAQRMLRLYDARIEPGHNLLDYITSHEEREIIRQNLERALAGEEFVAPDQTVGPAQAQVCLSVRYIPLRDENGTVVGAHIFSKDVTQLRQTEAAVQDSAGLYRGLFENMGAIILVIDPETAAIVDANQAACQFYGFSYAQLTGLKVLDLAVLPPEDVWARLKQIAAGKITHMRNQHRLANGEIRAVEVYLGRYLFKGQMANIVVVQDITERLQAEEVARQANARYQALFEQSQNAVFIMDTEGRYLDVNRNATTLLGYTRAEFLGLSVFEISAEPEKTRQVQDSLQKGVHVPPYERLMRKKDGEILLVEVNTEAVCDAQGQPTHFQSVVRDITERKQTEEKLRESEARYRLLFENMREGFALHEVIRDEHGQVVDFRILEVNRAYEEQTGTQRETAIGSKITELRPGADRTQIERYGRVALTGEPLIFEYYSKTFGRYMRVHAFRPQPLHFATIFEDISQIREAELALRASEARFRLLFERNQAIMLMVAPDNGTILDANQAAAEFYGYTREQLRQMKITALNTLHEEDIFRYMRMAKSGVKSAYIFPHQLASGEIRTVEVHSSPVELDGQTILYSIIHDITARIQAEARLRESERLLRTVLDTSPDAIVLKDTHLVYRYANLATCAMLGKSEAELVDKTFFDLFPKVMATAFQANNQRVLETRQAHMEDYQATTVKGLRWMNVVNAPILNEVGECTGIVSVIRDITERKMMEEALAAQGQRLANILRGTNAGTWEWNVQTGETTFNERWAEMLGYTLEELAPISINTWIALTHPEDLKKSNALLEQHFRGTLDYYACEARMRHKDGRWIWVLDRGKVGQWTAKGQPLLMFGTHQDITARHQAEEALRSAHAELEQRVQERTAELQTANLALGKALRLKEQFLASMSHELRTPLTGILGLAQVVQLPTFDPLTEKQAKAVANIEKSGQRLLELIDTILDFTMLQSDEITLDILPCALEELCQAALLATTPLAAAKYQQASFSMTPEKIALATDGRRLRQVLLHLLNNACKFTPRGGKLGLEVTGNPETRQVQIAVWDTGIGIQEADFPRLFQPFIQLDASLARQYEGVGLGLAMVKQLVELLGGSVSVESVFGQGSRFTVTLPWAG